MTRVCLSKAAAADLDLIDDYTIEHFGLDQATKTSERFRKTFELLGEMPRSGQLREEISPPGREFRYRTVLGSFVVVYEAADDGIRVARVPPRRTKSGLRAGARRRGRLTRFAGRRREALTAPAAPTMKAPGVRRTLRARTISARHQLFATRGSRQSGWNGIYITQARAWSRLTPRE